MCCGSGTYKRSRSTGQGVAVSRQQFRRGNKYQRFVKKGQESMVANPEVEKVPVIHTAMPVTAPATGEIDPSTGMPISVLKTGIDPTNIIPQPLPDAVNPVIIDANKGESDSAEDSVGTVTQAGGEG